MDYYFRRVKDHYEIAKFDPNYDQPIDVYLIYNFPHCTCKSPELPCKHAKLLERWLRTDGKCFYDDKRKEFLPHEFMSSAITKIFTDKKS